MGLKSKAIAYLLWCGAFFGFCGLHRFYAGKIITGLLWFFTIGLFGIGQLIDLILIPGMIDHANLKNAMLFGGNNQQNQQNQSVVVNIAAPPTTNQPQKTVNQ